MKREGRLCFILFFVQLCRSLLKFLASVHEYSHVLLIETIAYSNIEESTCEFSAFFLTLKPLIPNRTDCADV